MHNEHSEHKYILYFCSKANILHGISTQFNKTATAIYIF